MKVHLLAATRQPRPSPLGFRFVELILLGSLLLPACRYGETPVTRTENEAELAKALEAGTGIVELPPAQVVIHRELVIPVGASDLEIRGHPGGSLLRASDDFEGRAIFSSSSATALTFADFGIDGNRSALASSLNLPPSNVAFADFYPNNGILVTSARGLTISGVRFRNVASYPVLVSASSNVLIEEVMIEDSGSKNPMGRNNTTGGILIEEGTADFRVRHCRIERIGGNAIWTHSNYHSPRNTDGIIAENQVNEVARDAIQVGHATRIRVENNGGTRIGYPVEEVDVESGGTPVAIDTAGNVDFTAYLDNHFEDVNGQCIDLDGFHDGEVRGNSCVNSKPLKEYPFAHYGIVFGNTNPDMEPTGVTITDNLIEGSAYGGAFIIGSGHRIIGNRFLDLNRARCSGDFATAICNWGWDEPGMLRSGIYLGRGHARPADTRDNIIRDNEIQGFGMDEWCIDAAPGIELQHNAVGGNRCREGP